MAKLRVSGIGDEAGSDIHTQVRAHRELGWAWLDLRCVDGTNVTMLADAAFEEVFEAVRAAGLGVANFASGVCCWGRSVRDDFRLDVDELARAMPRMRRFGTRTIRVMSCPRPGGEDMGEDEFRDEVFRRLRLLARMAEDGGVVLVHEHVGSGWTGSSPERMLQLVEAVDSPSFRLLFDMANFDGPDAGEQSWAAYEKVKHHVAHVHLKDRASDGECTWFGEGVIPAARIVGDLAAGGYEGFVSMEPHIAAVHHTGRRASPEVLYECYVTNGRKVARIVGQADAPGATEEDAG